MSNTISGFLGTAHQFLTNAADGAMIVGRSIICLDRSEETFGEGTLPENLKGRDKRIKINLIHLVAMAAFIVLVAAPGAGHSISGFGYFLITIYSLGALILLKEIVIESIARSKEKRALYGDAEEAEETRCSLQEIIADHEARFHAIMDGFHQTMREITNTIFVSKIEPSTNDVELEERSS